MEPLVRFLPNRFSDPGGSEKSGLQPDFTTSEASKRSEKRSERSEIFTGTDIPFSDPTGSEKSGLRPDLTNVFRTLEGPKYRAFGPISTKSFFGPWRVRKIGPSARSYQKTETRKRSEKVRKGPKKGPKKNPGLYPLAPPCRGAGHTVNGGPEKGRSASF